MKFKIAPIVRTLAALLALAVGGVHAQTLSVDKPVMLVAKPGLEPPYGETVLIAIPAGESIHAGFILNRPLPQTVASLFPDDPAARNTAQPVRLGGPVMLDTLYAVVRQAQAGDKATIPLFDDVHMAVRADTIERIFQDAPNEARYFVGFVSWAPGELDHEIASGYWYVMQPQSEAVFRENDEDLWAELVRRARAPVALR